MAFLRTSRVFSGFLDFLGFWDFSRDSGIFSRIFWEKVLRSCDLFWDLDMDIKNPRAETVILKRSGTQKPGNLVNP